MTLKKLYRNKLNKKRANKKFRVEKRRREKQRKEQKIAISKAVNIAAANNSTEIVSYSTEYDKQYMNY